MSVRIVMDGMVGVCASMDVWPGFSANVVEPEKPFISETGYRSFLGLHADLFPASHRTHLYEWLLRITSKVHAEADCVTLRRSIGDDTALFRE
jgi:hypothetical protein